MLSKKSLGAVIMKGIFISAIILSFSGCAIEFRTVNLCKGEIPPGDVATITGATWYIHSIDKYPVVTRRPNGIIGTIKLSKGIHFIDVRLDERDRGYIYTGDPIVFGVFLQGGHEYYLKTYHEGRKWWVAFGDLTAKQVIIDNKGRQILYTEEDMKKTGSNMKKIMINNSDIAAGVIKPIDWYSNAYAYQEKKEYQQAIESYEKFIEVSAGDAQLADKREIAVLKVRDLKYLLEKEKNQNPPVAAGTN